MEIQDLSEKLQIRILTMLVRINYIAWSAVIIGSGIMLASGFFYTISRDDPDYQFQIGMIGFVGFLIGGLGFWMTRQVKLLRKSSLDLSVIDRKLTFLTIGALFMGFIAAVPLLYFAPIWGVVLASIFVLLLVDIIRLRALLWSAKSDNKKIISSSKSIFKKILKLTPWLVFFAGGIWLIIALGPLWIIAIILLLIFFVVASK